MLDLDLLRKQPDEVAAALERRGARAELEPILEADRRRRELVDRVQTLSGERKRIGKEIGERKRAGEDTAELEATATAAREELGSLSPELEQVEARLRELMLELPNVPDPRVPAGGKENNQVVREWGEQPDFPEGLGDHVDIATRLGLVDFERGIKLARAGLLAVPRRRRPARVGAARPVRERASRRRLRVHAAAAPPARGGRLRRRPVPEVLRRRVPPPDGGGRASALPPAHGRDRDPERVRGRGAERRTSCRRRCSRTRPCYRREAGGYRTEERGTVRGHQFNKVELFQFVRPEQAEQRARGARREGGADRARAGPPLPHVAARGGGRQRLDGDHLRRRGVDPEHGAYKEVSSASHAGDYQARRANVKYRPPDSKRSEFVHTLNASALATSRLVPALLEQHVQPDGSVTVPEPLQDRLGHRQNRAAPG